MTCSSVAAIQPEPTPEVDSLDLAKEIHTLFAELQRNRKDFGDARKRSQDSLF
jgi:hypothetical protein